MKWLFTIIIIVSLVSLGLLLYFSNANEKNVGKQKNITEVNKISQQTIVDNLSIKLKHLGVPVISTQIESNTQCNPPLVVDFILQSASENDKATLDDPIYLVIVGHEVTLALRRGLNVGGITTSFVNSQGKILNKNTCATLKTDEIPSQFDFPTKMDNVAVSQLIDQNLALSGIVLDKLEVITDLDGMRWAPLSGQGLLKVRV
jgi:hypothetical protein